MPPTLVILMRTAELGVLAHTVGLTLVILMRTAGLAELAHTVELTSVIPMRTAELGVVTDTVGLTILSWPKLHCGSLDFQVGGGQELLAHHER